MLPVGALVLAVSLLPTVGPTDSTTPQPIPSQVVAARTTPAKIKHVDPVYPTAERGAGITGFVIAELSVDATGAVTDVRVLRGASAGLDEASLAALRQWRFKPMLVNDQPTPFAYAVTIMFELASTPANDRQRLESDAVNALTEMRSAGSRSEQLTVTAR